MRVHTVRLTMWLTVMLLWGCQQTPAPTGKEAADEVETEQKAKVPAPDEVTVEQLDQWLDAGEATPVDANGEATRESKGHIPNAILLSSSYKYEVDKELPEDKAKNLVFYCGSTSCSASDTAAARAQEAGYTNVHILRAGIAGWLEAGKTAERLPAS